MKMHIWNKTIYPTYGDAKIHGALYECEVDAELEDVRRYGFNCGVIADAMEIVVAALNCFNVEKYFGAVIIQNGKIYAEY